MNSFLSLPLLTAVVEKPEQVDSVLDLIMKGGIIMIPIILLSIIAVYIFIDKFFYIRKCGFIAPGFAGAIIHDIAGKNNATQSPICSQANNAGGRIFEAGLSLNGQPLKEMETIMESAANIEVAHMEKNLGYLGIIAGIAPMLGFIGTISGVIKIFYNISLTDNISIGIIAGGLYQKMITSGTGLIVGVIAYAFYHYLHMQIDKFSGRLQEESFVFFKSMKR